MKQAMVVLRVSLFALGFMLVNMGVEVSTGGQATSTFTVSAFIGGVLMAVILAWIRSKTRLTKFGVISVFWFTLFVIQMFNNLLEALFFTNVFPSTKEFVEAIYVSMLTVLVEAFMAGVLFTSKKADLSLFSALHGYFDRRSRFSWSWRITAASLLYVAGALIPLILESSLPPAIVPVHCVELLADSLAYGLIVVRLLG